MPSEKDCSCDSSNKKTQFDSVLLRHLIGLFYDLSPEIECKLSKNGHILCARIPEEFLPSIELITNDDKNNNKLRLMGVSIFTESDLTKRITLSGVKEILQRNITKYDAKAFRDDKKTYKPFEQGFNGRSIGEVVDTIADLMLHPSKSTRNIKKVLELCFENSSGVNGVIIGPTLMGQCFTIHGNPTYCDGL